MLEHHAFELLHRCVDFLHRLLELVVRRFFMVAQADVRLDHFGRGHGVGHSSVS
jgi:hypothetical protein